MALVENLYETYKTAPNDIKRTYLRMFIDKVLIDDKKIVEVKLTPIAQKLLEIEQVRISGEIRRRQDSNLRPSCPGTVFPGLRTRPTMRLLLEYSNVLVILTDI